MGLNKQLWHEPWPASTSAFLLSISSNFSPGDLQDVLELDTLEDVTEDDDIAIDEEKAISENTFDTFADTISPSHTASSERALCMHISFLLHSG